MSARKLVEKWEEALAKALVEQPKQQGKWEVEEEELLQAGLPLASGLRAGREFNPYPETMLGGGCVTNWWACILF
jgi:hypothetical protein